MDHSEWAGLFREYARNLRTEMLGVMRDWLLDSCPWTSPIEPDVWLLAARAATIEWCENLTTITLNAGNLAFKGVQCNGRIYLLGRRPERIENRKHYVLVQEKELWYVSAFTLGEGESEPRSRSGIGGLNGLPECPITGHWFVLNKWGYDRAIDYYQREIYTRFNMQIVAGESLVLRLPR